MMMLKLKVLMNQSAMIKFNLYKKIKKSNYYNNR